MTGVWSYPATQADAEALREETLRYGGCSVRAEAAPRCGAARESEVAPSGRMPSYRLPAHPSRRRPARAALRAINIARGPGGGMAVGRRSRSDYGTNADRPLLIDVDTPLVTRTARRRA
jgi:hypothetical protein